MILYFKASSLFFQFSKKICILTNFSSTDLHKSSFLPKIVRAEKPFIVIFRKGERERDRERQKDRDRKTERQRDIETERQRETEKKRREKKLQIKMNFCD